MCIILKTVSASLINFLPSVLPLILVVCCCLDVVCLGQLVVATSVGASSSGVIRRADRAAKTVSAGQRAARDRAQVGVCVAWRGKTSQRGFLLLYIPRA